MPRLDAGRGDRLRRLDGRRPGPAGPRAALCCPPATPAGPPGPTTSCVRCSRRAAERLRGCLPSGGRGDRLHRRRRCLQGPGARRRAGRSPRCGPAHAQRRPRPTGSGMVVASPRRPSARHLRNGRDVADPGPPVRGAVECAPARGGGHRVRGQSAGRPHPLRGPGGRPGADPRHRDGNAGRTAGSCRPAGGRRRGGPAAQPRTVRQPRAIPFRAGAVEARRPVGHRDARRRPAPSSRRSRSRFCARTDIPSSTTPPFRRSRWANVHPGAAHDPPQADRGATSCPGTTRQRGDPHARPTGPPRGDPGQHHEPGLRRAHGGHRRARP